MREKTKLIIIMLIVLALGIAVGYGIGFSDGILLSVKVAANFMTIEFDEEMIAGMIERYYTQIEKWREDETYKVLSAQEIF